MLNYGVAGKTAAVRFIAERDKKDQFVMAFSAYDDA